MAQTEKVVVTQHKGLVEYLVDERLIDPSVPVIEHASPEDVTGKWVVGVLPLQLASLAERVTVVPLDIPIEIRKARTELTKEQVRQYAGKPATYRVLEVEDDE